MPSEPTSATMWKPQAASTIANVQRAPGGSVRRNARGIPAIASTSNANGTFDARIAGQLNQGGLP